MALFRLFVFTFMFALFVPGLSRGNSTHTFDEMTPAELDHISQVTLSYYLCVRDKLDSVAGADTSSPERILATYPPFIRILRQQCRISLLHVEKELYSLGLNPEFITNYVATLRDDVQYFALQHVLKEAEGEKAETAKRGEQGRKSNTETQKVRDALTGFGIFTPRKPPEGKSSASESANAGSVQESR